MITDAAELAKIQLDWAGVEKMRVILLASANLAMSGGGVVPFTLMDAAHNVPFLHAYGVLNNVLRQLKTEGHISCSSIDLRPLVNASELVLP